MSAFHIKKEIGYHIKLAVPLIIAQGLGAFMTFMDTAMSGWSSAKDLAGVGIGSGIWSVFFFMFIGFFVALNPVVARYRGAGDYKSIRNAVHQAARLGFFGAVFMTTMLLINPLYVGWFVKDPQIQHVVSGYLTAMAIGTPAVIGYLVLRPFCEGMGFTSAQMVAGLVGVSINAPLNYGLIFGAWGLPKLGGIGCGWATSIAYYAMFISLFIFIHYHKKFKSVELFKRWMPKDGKEIKHICSIGIPIGLSILAEGGVFASLALFLSGHGAPKDVIAGHSLAMNATYLLYIIPLGLASATSIRVGVSLGAKDFVRARKVGLLALGIAFCLASICAACIILFNHQIIHLYTGGREPEVAAVAVHLLVLAAFWQIADAMSTGSQGILRGYKDVRVVFGYLIFSYWIVGVPIGVQLAFGHLFGDPMGARGLWIGVIIGICLCAVLTIIRFLRVSNHVIAHGLDIKMTRKFKKEQKRR